jgi:outer membrane putative beta-barrel porin/alpha-amylase
MVRGVARSLVVAFLLIGSTLSVSAFAQTSRCPTSFAPPLSSPTFANNLICLVPQVYGPGGLVGTSNGGPLLPTGNLGVGPHDVHFQSASAESLGPLNEEIGTQISQLPLASPASGFIFSFNPGLGVVSRSTQSFGPILTDRSETIGKHRLFIGFSYQYFDFDRADGVNLRKLGAVYQHEPEPNLCVGQPPNAPPFFCMNGEPLFTNDVIATTNHIDLFVNQYTAVATFGITDRIDVSVAIPILNIRMSASSDATIHSFEPANPVIVPVGNNHLHQFVVPSPDPAHELVFGPSRALFSNGRTTTGIGDVIIRGKFRVLQRERSGLSVGVDVHTPTGDAMQFLGQGTVGVRPFVTYSRTGRVAPHGTFGYQRNGDSVLAGDPTGTATSTKIVKAHLPDILTYNAGVDAGINRRLTVSADFIGQSLLSAARIRATTFTDFAGNILPTISASTGTVNQESISAGVKISPVGKLLVTANVLFRLNEAGLTSKPTPLIGFSYTF